MTEQFPTFVSHLECSMTGGCYEAEQVHTLSAAATYAAYKQALADGRVWRDERVVLFNCATGLKYPLPRVTRTPNRAGRIDFRAL